MKRLIYGLASLALCAPLLANAAEGYVIADISLQAGPDTEYPSIVELYAGTPVSIQGCIQGWTWCDVIAGGDRGWVPGTFLEEDYSGQRVVVIDYGPRIGIPVIAFSIGAYWGHYYHDRPFYAERTQWESRAIRPHAPPRPSGVAAAHTGSGQRGSTATIAAPKESTTERNAAAQRERATTPQRTTTQDRATAQQQSTATERAQAAQRAEATSGKQSKERAAATAEQKRAATQAEQRVAERPQPRHEEPAAAKPADVPPQHDPDQRAQSPRGAVTAKAQPPKQQPQPKTKDELKAPKKDEKEDNGGGGKEP